MADTTKQLLVELQMQNKQFIKAVENVDSKLGKMNNQQKKSQGLIKKLRLGYIALAGVIGGVVVKGLANLAKKAFDAQETFSKFNTVFRSVKKEANTMALSLAKDFGLSSVKAKELLGDTGDLLTGFGFTGESALDLSTEVQKLAVDLASFTNFSGGAEGASQALTKALLGERESVKSLGIAILESDVKAKVKALEVSGKFTNETMRQKRAIATLTIAQEQSGNAMGDFARTSESGANQLRILGSTFEDISVNLGFFLTKTIEPLLPAINKIVGGFRDWVMAIREADDALNKYNEEVKAEISVLSEWGVKTKEQKLAVTDLANAYMDWKRDMATVSGEDPLAEFMSEEQINEARERIKTAGMEMNRLKELLAETDIKTGQQANEILDQTWEKRNQAIMQVEEQAQVEIEKSDEVTEKKLENNEKIKESDKELSDYQKFLKSEEFNATRDALSDISSLTQSNNKTLFKIGKASSIAQAFINNALAITKTMSTVPFPFNIPLAAGQAAAGAVQINKISNTKFQGKAQGGVVDDVMGGPINGEDGLIGIQRGESVLTREATVNLGPSTIDQINASGGRSLSTSPINITISNPNPRGVVNELNEYFREYGTSDRGVGI